MSDEFSQDIRDLCNIIDGDSEEKAVEMLEYCQRRLSEGSANPYVYLVMALISYNNSDAGLSLQLLERAHAMAPDCREVVDFLANIYTRTGRLADGLYYAKLAVCLKPRPDAAPLLPDRLASYADALSLVGVSYHFANARAAFHLGLFEEALDQAERHLRIHPDAVPVMLLAARTLLALKRPGAAASMARAALCHEPRNPWFHAILGDALTGLSRYDMALVHQRLASELAEEDDDALRGHLAGALQLQSAENWPQARQMIEAYHSDVETPRRAVTARGEGPGLMAALWDQVYDSPLMHCVSPVLKRLDKLVLYTLNTRHDLVGDGLRAAVLRQRPANSTDAATLGRIILGDSVRCLINLCAPSDTAAFPVFKGDKPPLIVHWINSPMTDRIPGAGLVIAGPETADLDECNYGADKVVTLDRLLAFEFPTMLSAEEEVSGLPCRERGFPMFGVHGNSETFTAEAVRSWARVLWAVPRAHLMIGGRDAWEEELTTWALETFAGFGLSERVHFQAPVEGHDASANQLFPHLVDIVLDSTPVNGSWDLAHDLWMGVPVVSLRGERRAGRVGASILHAAGCADWIAADEEGYIAIAARLANADDLGDIRAGLRARVLASPLADPEGLIAQMTDVLSQVMKVRSASS